MMGRLLILGGARRLLRRLVKSSEGDPVTGGTDGGSLDAWELRTCSRLMTLHLPSAEGLGTCPDDRCQRFENRCDRPPGRLRSAGSANKRDAPRCRVRGRRCRRPLP